MISLFRKFTTPDYITNVQNLQSSYRIAKTGIMHRYKFLAGNFLESLFVEMLEIYLAFLFDELCKSTGMKKSALAKICGKNAATFSRYCSGAPPVPQLAWDKVSEYKQSHTI